MKKLMKAIVFNKYGSIKDLSLKEVEIPKINEDEVLLKLLFTSLNAADLDFINGHPLVRFTGLFKPGFPILGSDLVGMVVEIGKKVTKLKVGDIVWADLSIPEKYSTFSEFTKAKEKSLQIIPKGIELADAACLPTAGMVAYQNIYKKKSPKPNDHVLVNGAGGGIGTMLVQMLVERGAIVTAVDSSEKLDALKTIGAKHVIDYKTNNIIDLKEQYDYVYDLVCFNKLKHVKKLVKKKGTLIVLGGSVRNMLKIFILGPLLSLLANKKIKMGGWDTNNLDDLKAISQLYLDKSIKPVIDEIVPIEGLINGLGRLAEGNVVGKIVVKYDI